MGKIIAADRRSVQVTSNDITIMRRRAGLSADEAEACATAFAATRFAHSICGPGTKAVMAILAGVPQPMRKRIGRELLKAA